MKVSQLFFLTFNNPQSAQLLKKTFDSFEITSLFNVITKFTYL